MQICDFLPAAKSRITEKLHAILPGESDQLHQAIRYAVLNGGKRLRPALVYATADVIGQDHDMVDAIAIAVELIHCYSLIHDDLPAMDNDDLRRGLPTCHKKFSEAVAILAGDALQSLAFEILTAPQHNPMPAEIRCDMAHTLASAIGANGIALGQSIDLAANNKKISLTDLIELHHRKTGDLIKTAIILVAKTKKVSAEQLSALSTFGQNIGLAFQIQDDILDITANAQVLGKTPAKDIRLNKATFPALMGLDQAKEYAGNLISMANAVLEQQFGAKSAILIDLAKVFVARPN